MIFDIEQFNSIEVWKQERLIAQANGFDTIKFYSDIEGSVANPIAVYTTPSDGVLYIDLTDYVRANPNVSELYFYNDTLARGYQIGVTMIGLINPASVLIPRSMIPNILISPPARMIASDAYNPITWECRPGAGRTYHVDWDGETSGTITTPTYTLPYDAQAGCLVGNQYGQRNITCIPRQCGVYYAMVRWESFTGATRCHTMEVVKAKSETKDAFSLLPIDNEYLEVKGREDGFTLRLNGLSAYDLWYYSDMIHSSKVEVKVENKDFVRVQVTKKSFTMPDGEASDGVLEIQVNWKRYDAVAM